MHSDKKIALFIDAENIPSKYAKDIFDYVYRYGNPIIRRIYADWSKPHVFGWRDEIFVNSLTAMQQFSSNKVKNSSDMYLATDALSVFYEKQIDIFIIVSSDSDYTSLVQKLRESDKTLVGIGFENANDKYTRSFHQFCTLCKHPEDEIIDTMTSEHSAGLAAIIDELIARRGRADYSLIKNAMQKQLPDLSLKRYGLSKFKQLMDKFLLSGDGAKYKSYEVQKGLDTLVPKDQSAPSPTLAAPSTKVSSASASADLSGADLSIAPASAEPSSAGLSSADLPSAPASANPATNEISLDGRELVSTNEILDKTTNKRTSKAKQAPSQAKSIAQANSQNQAGTHASDQAKPNAKQSTKSKAATAKSSTNNNDTNKLAAKSTTAKVAISATTDTKQSAKQGAKQDAAASKVASAKVATNAKTPAKSSTKSPLSSKQLNTLVGVIDELIASKKKADYASISRNFRQASGGFVLKDHGFRSFKELMDWFLSTKSAAKYSLSSSSSSSFLLYKD